jgi:type III secretion system YscI/HrpB-like protein
VIESAQKIAFLPQPATVQSAGQGQGPSVARPDSVARFEVLMFAPGGTSNASTPATPQTTAPAEPGRGRLQGWVEDMSAQWKGVDQEIARMTTAKDMSPQELLSLQHKVLTASVSVELTSKSAGIVERDIQTLIQRS